MKDTRTITIPSRFFGDCLANCVDVGRAVDTKGARLVIEATPQQIDELRGRAEYYTDRDGPDWCPPGVKASARATLAALDKAGA